MGLFGPQCAIFLFGGETFVRPQKWEDSQVGFRGSNASGRRIVLLPGVFWAHGASKMAILGASLLLCIHSVSEFGRACFRQARVAWAMLPQGALFRAGAFAFLPCAPKSHLHPLPHLGPSETWENPTKKTLRFQGNLEGPTRKPRHASVFSTHSDTQAVPAFHCIRLCLKAFFRHASVFKTHRHAVYHCLKEVQEPFRHASAFKTRVSTRACPFLNARFRPSKQGNRFSTNVSKKTLKKLAKKKRQKDKMTKSHACTDGNVMNPPPPPLVFRRGGPWYSHGPWGGGRVVLLWSYGWGVVVLPWP